MNEFTLTLNSPLTEEQWDIITDVDFEHTSEITFHTKHGKEVVFVKKSAQTEHFKPCKNCVHFGHAYMAPCKNCRRNQMMPDWYTEETE